MVIGSRSKNKAGRHTVEELVEEARRGRLRMPRFQRSLRWKAEDVKELFDSIYNGFPIGSLLLWVRPMGTVPPAAFIGPVPIPHPAEEHLRWVVDGQQRITALTAALTRARDPDPRFDVLFDPDNEEFVLPKRSGVPPHFVAVDWLLDAAELGEHLMEVLPGEAHRLRRRRVLEAGKRIREFPVPYSQIETDDPRVVREIFRRANNRGRGMTEDEVFNALIGAEDASLPSLGRDLETLGWGEIKQATLLAAVMVNEGLDPTRSLDRQVHDQDRMAKSSDRLAPGVHAAIGFLRTDAGIVHRAVLPYRVPLLVLPTIFARHPKLSARARRLLKRWVWRGLVSGAHQDSQKAQIRRSAKIAFEVHDPELAGEALLRLVPRKDESGLNWKDGYRANTAKSSLVLLTLSMLEPRDLVEPGHPPLDIAQLFCAEGNAAPKKLVAKGQGHSSIANRALHTSSTGLVSLALTLARELGENSGLLDSHALTPNALHHLAVGEVDEFLKARALTIGWVTHQLGDEFAEWDADDSAGVRELFEKQES